MARIRSQHPGIFTDEAYMALSFAAREAMRGLWAHADDHGVFEWKPVTLKARIFPADSVDFPGLLAELENAGFVRTYQAEGRSFGVVRNFMKYQRPRKPSYVHPLPAALYGYIGMPGSGPAEPWPGDAGELTPPLTAPGTELTPPLSAEKAELAPQREEEEKEGVKEEQEGSRKEEVKEEGKQEQERSRKEGGKQEGTQDAGGGKPLAAAAALHTDSSLSWTVDHEAALVSAFRQERQALWPGCGPAPGALCSPADRATAAKVLALSARLGLPEGQMRGMVRDYLRGRLTAIRDKGRPAPVSLAYFQTALCEHLTSCTGGNGWSAAAAAPHSPHRKAPATVTGAEADRIILTTLGLWPED